MSRLVVSPDAIVRYMRGRTWVHTGTGKVWSDPSPLLSALLPLFVTPRDPADVVAALAAEQRNQATAAIDALARIGALVIGTEQPAARAPEPAARVDTHLAPIVSAASRIAGHLNGLGPAADGVADSGVDLGARLTTLLAGITALEAELTALRPAHLEAQLHRLGLAPDASGLKLHLGAGPSRLDGWVNIDAHPAELSMDLRWGLPFADGAADYVFMAHTLEHLTYPHEVEPLLRDLRRVLAPGGRLRLVVPDIQQCLEAYVASDDEFFAARRRTWTWWPESHTRLEGFLAYAGAGGGAAEFFDSHKFGYDFDTLAGALVRAGFRDVERSGFMASADPVLRVDASSSVAGARHGDVHYALFVEAVPDT